MGRKPQKRTASRPKWSNYNRKFCDCGNPASPDHIYAGCAVCTTCWDLGCSVEEFKKDCGLPEGERPNDDWQSFKRELDKGMSRIGMKPEMFNG